jgi:hypothetical protein
MDLPLVVSDASVYYSVEWGLQRRKCEAVGRGQEVTRTIAVSYLELMGVGLSPGLMARLCD